MQAHGKQTAHPSWWLSVLGQPDPTPNISFFFLRERERDSVHMCAHEYGGSAEGEGESQVDSTPSAQCGAQSHDPEIMPWAKINSQMLNQLSHPGAPISEFS